MIGESSRRESDCTRLRQRLGQRSGLSNAIQEGFDLLAHWRELRRQRRALGRLDDRLLKDIGLSRADVEEAARMPFWR